MKARIVLTKSDDPKYREERVIPDELITIGRHEENAVHLNDPKRVVSKRHATIERAEDEFHLVDLKSVNGTFQNGARLEAGKPYCLKDGDSVQIANYLLQFFCVVEPPVTTPEIGVEEQGAGEGLLQPDELSVRTVAQRIQPPRPKGVSQPSAAVAEGGQRTDRMLEILLSSLMHLMKAKEHFRQEFLGTTMVQNRNVAPLLSENVQEAKSFFLAADASPQVVAEREAALSQAANDVQIHLVAFLEGYRRSVDEGTKKFLQQTDPAVLRERLGKLIWKVGPFEISYKYLPVFFQIKLMEMYVDRHWELRSEDRGVLETRYFRPGFTRAYEACLTAAKKMKQIDEGKERKSAQPKKP
jgi:predicted component of type VI protein secretion system